MDVAVLTSAFTGDDECEHVMLTDGETFVCVGDGSSLVEDEIDTTTVVGDPPPEPSQAQVGCIQACEAEVASWGTGSPAAKCGGKHVVKRTRDRER